MKKRYAVILMVICFVFGLLVNGTPSIGAKKLKVYINGLIMQEDLPVMIDGRLFVPLDEATKMFGGEFYWYEDRNEGYSTTERNAIVSIDIDERLKLEIDRSLCLIASKDYEKYRFLSKYVSKIVYDENAVKMYMQTEDQTIHVPLNNTYVTGDEYWWSYMLVHEATHSMQVHSGEYYNIEDVDKEALYKIETEAHNNGMETLKNIGCNQKLQDWIEKTFNNSWDVPFKK